MPRKKKQDEIKVGDIIRVHVESGNGPSHVDRKVEEIEKGQVITRVSGRLGKVESWADYYKAKTKVFEDAIADGAATLIRDGKPVELYG